jgi:hypothetical protein
MILYCIIFIIINIIRAPYQAVWRGPTADGSVFFRENLANYQLLMYATEYVCDNTIVEVRIMKGK